MEISVTFKSDLFRPFLPEESQVNPQVYGAELAYWLSWQLARKGVVTSYPVSEDWGWFIEYITAEGDEYWLCCSNCDGENDRWLCFLDPKPKAWFGRNKAKPEQAGPLLGALADLLEETQGIGEVSWVGR